MTHQLRESHHHCRGGDPGSWGLHFRVCERSLRMWPLPQITAKKLTPPGYPRLLWCQGGKFCKFTPKPRSNLKGFLCNGYFRRYPRLFKLRLNYKISLVPQLSGVALFGLTYRFRSPEGKVIIVSSVVWSQSP